MKKTTILLLAVTMALSALVLTACGEKNEPMGSAKSSTTESKAADDSADDSKAKDPATKTYPWTVHPETACTVNGTDFEFPTVTGQEMCDLLDLTPHEYAFSDINSVSDGGAFTFKANKGEDYISITVRNLTDKDKSLLPVDCHVISVEADKQYAGDMNVCIREIGLGSTEAELLAAFSEFGKDENSSVEKESHADEGETPYTEYYYEIINPTYFYGHSYQFEVTDSVVTYVDISEGGGVFNYTN